MAIMARKSLVNADGVDDPAARHLVFGQQAIDSVDDERKRVHLEDEDED
jgi:hypothetical protein